VAVHQTPLANSIEPDFTSADVRLRGPAAIAFRSYRIEKPGAVDGSYLCISTAKSLMRNAIDGVDDARSRHVPKGDR
jgi:hypothetical protein